MEYDLLVGPSAAEAVFEAGSKKGEYLNGWTTNRMRVPLWIEDVPFDLSACAKLPGYYTNGNSMYRISAAQRDALMAALAAKVAASEDASKTAPAALVARKGN